MSANSIECRDIKKLRKQKHITEISAESQFIVEFLGGDPMGDGVSYEQVAPEDVGALTSAPLISDGTNVFGYMNYQVENFLELLAEGKTIVWNKG